MSRRPPKPAPVVVKRASEERKRLPPELEAFARSDQEKLRIRRPRVDRGKVNDPREGYTIPGVANRDARAVYDQRVAAMQQLWQQGPEDEAAQAELGLFFLDAARLGLWRARRVMDFAAFAEEVVGVPAEQARALAEAASLRVRESNAQLSERDVALWLRTEAGLYEGDPAARARIRTTLRGSVLELSVGLGQVSPALLGAGARHFPLVRGTEERGAEAHELDERAHVALEGTEAEQPGIPQTASTGAEGATVNGVPGGARLLKRRPQPAANLDEAAPRRDAWARPQRGPEGGKSRGEDEGARRERPSYRAGEGAAWRERGAGGARRGGFREDEREHGNRGGFRGDERGDRGGFRANDPGARRGPKFEGGGRGPRSDKRGSRWGAEDGARARPKAGRGAEGGFVRRGQGSESRGESWGRRESGEGRRERPRVGGGKGGFGAKKPFGGGAKFGKAGAGKKGQGGFGAGGFGEKRAFSGARPAERARDRKRRDDSDE